ncbi:unnamed protein product [Arctogadus glacialis]
MEFRRVPLNLKTLFLTMMMFKWESWSTLLASGRENETVHRFKLPRAPLSNLSPSSTVDGLPRIRAEAAALETELDTTCTFWSVNGGRWHGSVTKPPHSGPFP